MKTLIKILLVMNLAIWILTTGLIFTAAFSKDRLITVPKTESVENGSLQGEAKSVNQFDSASDRSGASSSSKNLIKSFYTISKIPQYLMLIITIMFMVSSGNSSKLKKDMAFAEEKIDEKDGKKVKPKENDSSMSALTIILVVSITILIVQAIIFRMIK